VTETVLAGKRVLVTGASGGIGAALVDAFLYAGAAEVIAAARHAPPRRERVTSAQLDVTDAASVAALAGRHAAGVDVLVNNAGFNGNCGALEPAAGDAARAEMEVNYFGTLNMLRAFAPAMRSRGQGVIVNMLTMLSHVNLPLMGSYCASKAAALSLTQAARAELAPAGVRVLAMLPSAVDTRMSAASPPPKLAPAEVAATTVRAIREGVEDCYPGKTAVEFHAAFRQDPKGLEKRLAARLPARRSSLG
jgi:NAD(P)-dependent dehydrogenase (short-subunit alcohol dehydrogenase family)